MDTRVSVSGLSSGWHQKPPYSTIFSKSVPLPVIIETEVFSNRRSSGNMHGDCDETEQYSRLIFSQEEVEAVLVRAPGASRSISICIGVGGHFRWASPACCSQNTRSQGALCAGVLCPTISRKVLGGDVQQVRGGWWLLFGPIRWELDTLSLTEL